MIIEIDFLKIERSEVRKAVMAAFDLLCDSEKGGIFRDDYGIVCKDNPGQIILEVSDNTDEWTKCLVWLQAGLSWLSAVTKPACSQITIAERWYEVEY